MVSILYFSLIYPTLDPDKMNSTDYLKHSLPAGLLLLEFLLNSIVIEVRYVMPVLAFGNLYLLWLIYYTKSDDRWIYSILKLDKMEDWGLLFLIILSYLIVFAVLLAMNELKFTLVNREALKSTVSATLRKEEQKRYQVDVDRGQDQQEAVRLIILA